MTNDDKIRDEKLQYYINRETASISQQVKLINWILYSWKKYYLLVKEEW